MDQVARNLVPIRIQDEMRNSYLDYSMSVIIGRALPDVRDGLKPVHRRILYAMHQMGLTSGRKYSKCAGVVGEVLKKYHPHGDGAVYDALVRMAQPWNLRYMLVDGQGNFGSVDGDPAAAYRYTECRMTRPAEELLVDIEKDTVSFSPNFDGQTGEPDVLPSRLPNLLVNGSEGIAVGMATKIPPHNLREVVDACIALIDDPDLGVLDLLQYIPGPDFPTAGTIYGRQGIHDAYRTGRGRVVVRGRAEFETLANGREAICIDELPYQVNKSRLIEQIADLVKDKKLTGIFTIRDESDRQGMRIVIELKRDAVAEVVLNHLYKHTPMQNTFGVIMLAIVNNRPRVLTLKEMITYFIAHRREVIFKRTRFELKKALARAHILEGFRIALDNIDEVIALIRASPSVSDAREGLVARFGLSVIQAQAILDMRLQRLTGMERQRIEDEYAELMVRVEELRAILASETLLMGVVKNELIEVRDAYGDERRTRIVEARSELTMHDLVAEEDQIVTVSHLGYIKRCNPDEWQMQRRGGVGKKGMSTRDEDFVTSIFVANTHSLLLVFTDQGTVFPLHVYDVPAAGRSARGRPIINLVPVPDGERVAAVVSVRDLDDESKSLLFVSRLGLIKRIALNKYKNLRSGGMRGYGVGEGDALLAVRLMNVDPNEADVMLLTKNGKCLRFPLVKVPESGRTARGNRGMRLVDDDVIVDTLVVVAGGVEEDSDDDEVETSDEGEGEDLVDEYGTTLLTVTELGYGKRTPFDRYPTKKHTNTKGVMSIRLRDENGCVAGAAEVSPDDQVMLVTDTGRIIRIAMADVRIIGRNTQGVRLMRLEPDERIVDLVRLVDDDDGEEGVHADADVSADPDNEGGAEVAVEAEVDDTGSDMGDEPDASE